MPESPESKKEEDAIDTSEALFDPSLKKKKKKKKLVDSEEVVGSSSKAAEDAKVPATTTEGGDNDEEDINAMFSDLKKKKKKKSTAKTTKEDTVPVEAMMEKLHVASEVEGGAPNGESDDDDDNSADMDFEPSDDENGDVIMTSGGVSGDAAAGKPGHEEDGNPEDAWKDSDRDYTYPELLARVFRIIREHNPELSGERRKYMMVAPIVGREGSKKTAFANIVDICKRMKRPPEHLIAYIFAELGTQGSVDGSQRLIIKGKFQQKQIESVLRHYIGEYVTCQTCKSADTTMKKENKLFFLQCAACGSSRAVSAIKSGFRAQTAKRKTMRQ
eukprot:Partr_v1_DN25005_c0_g1_i1_m50956 putative eukaryotic translation initiation factor 2